MKLKYDKLLSTVAFKTNLRRYTMGLKSITGHSMGGHGALTIAFKNPDAYASVSAFSPICNPSAVPWGNKAFAAYLAGRCRLKLVFARTE